MPRRWVKEELKKNPLERAVIKLVKFVRTHKNEVITGAGALIVIGVFATLMIRQRIQKNLEAGKIFAMAQADFQSFRYNEAIEKFRNIEQQYPEVQISDMVSYMKALAYIRQENYEQAKEVLREAQDRHGDSKLIDHMHLSLAKACEELQEYEQALENYRKIDPGHYLYPEALVGQATIRELTGEEEKAIELYRQAASNYPHYVWGETASNRLQALGEPLETPALEEPPTEIPVPETEEPIREQEIMPEEDTAPLEMELE